jgi:hypothetical protein
MPGISPASCNAYAAPSGLPLPRAVRRGRTRAAGVAAGGSAADRRPVEHNPVEPAAVIEIENFCSEGVATGTP